MIEGGVVECLETVRDVEVILEEKRGSPWRVGTLLNWTGLSCCCCWMVRPANLPDPDERFRMLGVLPEKTKTETELLVHSAVDNEHMCRILGDWASPQLIEEDSGAPKMVGRKLAQ